MHEKLAVEIQKILQRKNLVFTSTFVDFFSKDEHVQQLDQLLLHLGVDFNRIIACEQLDLFAKKSTYLNHDYDVTVSDLMALSLSIIFDCWQSGQSVSKIFNRVRGRAIWEPS